MLKELLDERNTLDPANKEYLERIMAYLCQEGTKVMDTAGRTTDSNEENATNDCATDPRGDAGDH